jgi:hypothetical protein
MGFFKNFFKALTNPKTLIAATIMFFVAGPVGALSTLQSIAVYAAANAALTALSPVPDIPTFGGYGEFVSEASSRTQMIKQPAQPRRVVYGKVRVSGVLSYVTTTEDDSVLHLIISCCTHEINQFVSFRIDENNLTMQGNEVSAPDRYLDGTTKLIEINTHNGSDSQAADTLLTQRVKEWTTDHRLRGVAYMYCQLKFNAEAFPQGLPNISAIVEGKKVYDPRDSSTAYSRNSALCIRDYLTDTRYGLACSADEIDDASFITAANVCDENVTLASGGTQKRYTLDGTFQTSDSPKKIIENMLTSCGGILTYTNGKFRLLVAEYRTPSITLTQDDFHGPIQLAATQSQMENYNSVKGVYSPESNGFTPTDYPQITSATFVSEDNGETRYLDYSLPYTTDSFRAQRLAKIVLYRNRQQVVLQCQLSMKGFDLAVGDTCYVTLPRYGFSNKVFEVAEWNIAIVGGMDLGVDVTLRETNSAVYDWNAEEQVFQEDNSTLPDPFIIPAPVVTAEDIVQTFQQGAITTLQVTVSSPSVYANQFEVEAKKTTETTYTSLGTQKAGIYELVNVQAGATYDVRARAISTFQTKSPFTNISHSIAGKGTTSPSNVSDLTLDYLGSNALLSWTPVTDEDLSHYVVSHQSVTSGGSFDSAITLAKKVPRPASSVTVPALQGTYFCVAIDKYGNSSSTAAQVIGIIDQAPVSADFLFVQSITESPSFNGIKTNVTKPSDEDVLILSTSILFDSGSGLFDSAAGLFDGGPDGVVSLTGTYDFDTVFDALAKQTIRATFDITFSRRQYDEQKPASQNTVDCQMFVATTDDDPTSGSASFTDFTRFVAADYTARGFKFRLQLTTTDIDDTPVVSAITATVSIGKRLESEGNVSSGTSASGKVITFPFAFKELSGIGISAQNMNSGEFYQITNRTSAGFTIIFKESNNTVVDRTFDYVAQGFGRISA